MMTGLLSFAPLTAIWAESMLRACWQGGLVIALVWVISRLPLPLTPWVRCWLWRLAYVKLLLSLIGLTPISLPLLPVVDAPWASVPEATQITLSGPSGPPVQQRGANPLHVQSPMSFGSLSSPQSFDSRGLLACAWLTGVMLVGMRIVYAWYGSRRLRRCATSIDDPGLTSICHRLCNPLGIATPPRLMVTDALMSPALLGFIQPTILLPKPLLDACTQRECELILAHELAHMKRRDLLWQSLPACANALLFFYPLVWLA